MGRPRDFSWVLAAIAAMFIGGDLRVGADTFVTGSVFCDQCKDGHWSLFDYPLSGAKVAVTCGGADGQMTAYREDSTNWLGCYTVRFEGSPDLSGCYARVVGGPEGCGAAAGPARGLTLMFRMFGMAMYTVDPMLSQPQQPMEFCPHDSAPPSSPTPMLPHLPPPPHVPRPPPGLPSLEASACSYEYDHFPPPSLFSLSFFLTPSLSNSSIGQQYCIFIESMSNLSPWASIDYWLRFSFLGE